MIATSEDVAKRAGVSRGAVSQILNGRGERFAANTRERVERAARDLGYQPSVAARTLARGSSDIVIALIPNTTFGGNLQNLFEALTDELAKRGLTLVLRLSTPSTASLDRVVAGVQPRAVVSLTPLLPDERGMLEDRGVKAIDPTTARRDINQEIGALQAQHLIERGYRRLAFAHLRDARQDPFGQQREKGFRDECRDHELPEPVVLHLNVDPDDAIAALDHLDGPGVAVACYNDDVATALLYAASIRGWSVPDDLAVIGMDHTPLSRVTTPPLTTVDYDIDATVQGSINGILAALDGAESPSARDDIRLRVVKGATT